MGHVQGRDARAPEDEAKLVNELLAQGAIKRGQRLVEHQQARPGSKGACQRDALLFAAREFCDLPTLKALKVHGIKHFRDTLRDGGTRPVLHAWAKCDIPEHIEVRKEGVVLEDEAKVAQVCRRWSEITTVPKHGAGFREVQAGNELQDRRLPATRCPKQADRLIAADSKRNPAQQRLSLIALDDFPEFQQQNSAAPGRRAFSITRMPAVVMTIRMVAMAIAWP